MVAGEAVDESGYRAAAVDESGYRAAAVDESGYRAAAVDESGYRAAEPNHGGDAPAYEVPAASQEAPPPPPLRPSLSGNSVGASSSTGVAMGGVQAVAEAARLELGLDDTVPPVGTRVKPGWLHLGRGGRHMPFTYLSKSAAEALLQASGTVPGTFLVRRLANSAKNPDYALALLHVTQRCATTAKWG